MSHSVSFLQATLLDSYEIDDDAEEPRLLNLALSGLSNGFASMCIYSSGKVIQPSTFKN